MQSEAGNAAGADPARDRRAFLDLAFDLLSAAQVADWLRARDRDSAFGYVVTPNVDHIVRLERRHGFIRAAYAEAALCLCDSRVLARLAAACGVPLTVVPGSDLVADLFGSILRPGDAVCLVGGSDAIAARLRARFPDFDIRHHAPPMGLIDDAGARAEAVAAAIATRARVTLLAVGSPQQELLALEMARSGRATGTALCIGASVDFLVGAQRRAPRAVQRVGLEWAWRLASQPARLWRRYLVDGPAIFAMAWRWRRDRRCQE